MIAPMRARASDFPSCAVLSASMAERSRSRARSRGGHSFTVRLPLDCRSLDARAIAPAKIETIPRHGAAIGADIRHEEEMVKKIA